MGFGTLRKTVVGEQRLIYKGLQNTASNFGEGDT